MPIDSQEITDKEKDKILQLEEGHFSDIKAKEIEPKKLTCSISAFSNSDGGELYLGIQEDKKAGKRYWKGFENIEAANGFIQSFEEIFPLGEHYSYVFLKHKKEKGLLLQITVLKNPGIVNSRLGFPFIRRGAQNLPVRTPEELKRLERQKGISSFENELVGIDPALLVNSKVMIKFIREVVPQAQPGPWLNTQRLVQLGKPAVAGILLFSDLPQAILPKRSGIKISRYRTDRAQGNRETLEGNPLSIEGCSYDIIYEAVSKTKEIIKGVQVLGPKGLENVEYPTETLHEVITNAVLHRDYSVADDVHVRIFDNRVEVISPGKLPAHITTQNILDERFARNGSLVRIINKFQNPPNKDMGEGLNTAFEAMRRMRLRDPLIKEGENTVEVHIRHERLASPETIVKSYLDTHGNITNAQGRKLTGIESENRMKAVFIRLKKTGLIEPVPGLKGFRSAWRKKQKKTKGTA